MTFQPIRPGNYTHSLWGRDGGIQRWPFRTTKMFIDGNKEENANGSAIWLRQCRITISHQEPTIIELLFFFTEFYMRIHDSSFYMVEQFYFLHILSPNCMIILTFLSIIDFVFLDFSLFMCFIQLHWNHCNVPGHVELQCTCLVIDLVIQSFATRCICYNIAQ